jgi:hypothetical protein
LPEFNLFWWTTSVEIERNHKWEVCVLNSARNYKNNLKPSKVQRHLFFSFSGNYFTGDGAFAMKWATTELQVV